MQETNERENGWRETEREIRRKKAESVYEWKYTGGKSVKGHCEERVTLE